MTGMNTLAGTRSLASGTDEKREAAEDETLIAAIVSARSGNRTRQGIFREH
jgi:hypothetical protein